MGRYQQSRDSLFCLFVNLTAARGTLPGVTRTFVLVIAMLACACGGESDSGDPPLLPTRQLTVSQGTVSQKVTAELALSAAEQQQGLMFRQSMPEDRGMLFILGRQLATGFWMKNTYLPLDIAYLDADGTVLDIIPGEPLNETIHKPKQPYWNVLEMNQGWFQRHNLGIGAKVDIPKDLPTPLPTPTRTASP